jgi:hypothetical protein
MERGQFFFERIEEEEVAWSKVWASCEEVIFWANLPKH